MNPSDYFDNLAKKLYFGDNEYSLGSRNLVNLQNLTPMATKKLFDAIRQRKGLFSDPKMIQEPGYMPRFTSNESD